MNPCYHGGYDDNFKVWVVGEIIILGKADGHVRDLPQEILQPSTLKKLSLGSLLRKSIHTLLASLCDEDRYYLKLIHTWATMSPTVVENNNNNTNECVSNLAARQ